MPVVSTKMSQHANALPSDSPTNTKVTVSPSACDQDREQEKRTLPAQSRQADRALAERAQTEQPPRRAQLRTACVHQMAFKAYDVNAI
jgi:hypothetical protein